MARRGRETGQASVELIAAIPALILVTLLVAQLASPDTRCGAPASPPGLEPGRPTWAETASARPGASLPGALRKDATVSDRHGVRVQVRAPSLVPGVPRVPVTARAGLGVGDGGGR